jgi:hypothetical protein
MRERKKFWLLPIVIALLLFGGLIVFTQGSAMAPVHLHIVLIGRTTTELSPTDRREMSEAAIAGCSEQENESPYPSGRLSTSDSSVKVRSLPRTVLSIILSPA